LFGFSAIICLVSPQLFVWFKLAQFVAQTFGAQFALNNLHSEKIGIFRFKMISTNSPISEIL
jgi:hypothetical protein